jgi:hypothetical protein
MIANGFVKDKEGTWVNLKIIEFFKIHKHSEKNEIYTFSILAYLKTNSFVWIKDFETVERAQYYLDNMMTKQEEYFD